MRIFSLPYIVLLASILSIGHAISNDPMIANPGSPGHRGGGEDGPAPAYAGLAYRGRPQEIPGSIIGWKFDEGGAGVAYMDHTVAMDGASYLPQRDGEDVNSASGNSELIGWIDSGDWLRYTVDIDDSCDLRISYSLQVDKVDVPVPVEISMFFTVGGDPCDGDGQRYGKLFTKGMSSGGGVFAMQPEEPLVGLPGGESLITLCFEMASFINFEKMVFTQDCQTGGLRLSSQDWPDQGTPEDGEDQGKWVLAWSDEFDGSALNTDNWEYETGWKEGWTRGELQNYTDGTDSVTVEGGHLVIRAKPAGPNDAPALYTSGSIHSKPEQDAAGHWGAGKEMRYGRLEARAQFSRGRGLWGSLELLPSGTHLPGGEGVYGPWPTSGEIDVLEIANNMDQYHSSIHYGYQPPGDAMKSCRGKIEEEYVGGFHTYALEWDQDEIRWYFAADGLSKPQLTCSFDNWFSAGWGESSGKKPFDQYFYVRMGLAIGGFWPGLQVDESLFEDPTHYPMAKIDYIRVYDLVGAPQGRRQTTVAAPMHPCAGSSCLQ